VQQVMEPEHRKQNCANMSCLICHRICHQMAMFAAELYCWHHRSYRVPAWSLCYTFWLSCCVDAGDRCIMDSNMDKLQIPKLQGKSNWTIWKLQI